MLGLLISPLAGLFLLGIFTTRTSALAAAVGAATSIAVLWYVQRQTPLNFMLYGAVGTSTCVVSALLVSFIARERRALEGLTWWTRSRHV